MNNMDLFRKLAIRDSDLHPKNNKLPVAAANTVQPVAAPKATQPAPSGTPVVAASAGATEACVVSIIQFDLNSYSLSDAEKSHIKAISQGIPSSYEGEVMGYTCDLGSRKHNKLLSFNRAQAVADALKSYGITAFKISGKGQCCTVSENKELNRRVEIIARRHGVSSWECRQK